MFDQLDKYLNSILNAPEEELFSHNMWTFLEMGFQMFVNDTGFFLNCIEKILQKIEKHFGGHNKLPYTRIAALKQKLVISNLMYEMSFRPASYAKINSLEGECL